MKKILLLCICSVFILGCKKQTTTNLQKSESKLTGFTINGNAKNLASTKIYLNKIIGNSLYRIDSSNVENGYFNFKGFVEFPERYALTYSNYSTVTIVILENKNFEITLNTNNLNDPKIEGSNLNSQLNEYKAASKEIFKKINYLYPQFQKARLENDASALTKIGIEMQAVENEFNTYSFNFVITNKNSYVAAMILNDQLKSDKIDTLKIIETYKLLNDSIKKSPDAQIIASTLNIKQ